MYLKDEAKAENANIRLIKLTVSFLSLNVSQLSLFSYLLHHLWTTGITNSK